MNKFELELVKEILLILFEHESSVTHSLFKGETGVVPETCGIHKHVEQHKDDSH